jgi:hypothetical protein
MTDTCQRCLNPDPLVTLLQRLLEWHTAAFTLSQAAATRESAASSFPIQHLRAHVAATRPLVAAVAALISGRQEVSQVSSPMSASSSVSVGGALRPPAEVCAVCGTCPAEGARSSRFPASAAATAAALGERGPDTPRLLPPSLAWLEGGSGYAEDGMEGGLAALLDPAASLAWLHPALACKRAPLEALEASSVGSELDDLLCHHYISVYCVMHHCFRPSLQAASLALSDPLAPPTWLCSHGHTQHRDSRTGGPATTSWLQSRPDFSAGSTGAGSGPPARPFDSATATSLLGMDTTARGICGAPVC